MSKSPKKSKSLTRAGNRPATISAQQTIPYVRMLPDGICQLPGGVYTKTLEYEDINYSVASAEDQTAIFGGWSSWLNYFAVPAFLCQPPQPLREPLQGEYLRGG